MKTLFAAFILLAAFATGFAQNEQAPMQEKEIAYQNWTYKSIRTGEDVNLRELTKGKKLTIVVYFAPWCGNWKHDAPILQRFYDKYKDKGLEIVAVGLYDPLDSMKANLNELKVTFPAVYESAERSAKQTSLHYKYRRSTGDVRNWGSPWYIFLTPAVMEKTGDTLTKKTFIINGEVIESEGEAFIKKQLGLSADTNGAIAKSGKIEVCDPNDSKTSWKKPE